MTFYMIKKVSHKVQLNLSFHIRAQFEMDGSSFSYLMMKISLQAKKCMKGMREMYKVFRKLNQRNLKKGVNISITWNSSQSAWISCRAHFAGSSEAVRPHILRRSLIENLNHSVKCLFVFVPDIRIT